MIRALFRHSLATVLATAALASSVRAQDAVDADVRRLVQAFRSAAPAATLASAAQIQLSRLTMHDRAIVEMYRGFALHRLHRTPESELAMQRAAAADPTVIPLPEMVGQDLVDVYRVNRARIPIVATFNLTPLDFIPQLDSSTRLSYQIEGGRILRRGRAQLRWMVVRRGSTDTSVVWRGAEGDSNIVWNGMINSRLIEPGDYDYVIEARGSDIPVTSYRARAVRIAHVPVDSSRMLSRPSVPRALPESSVFMVDDRERRAVLVKRAIIIAGIGAVMAGTASAFVQTAIDRSPPRSGMRYAVAGTYVAGLVTIGMGGIVAWRSRSGRFRSEVAFPNNENIRLNRELRTEYTAELERVNRYNDMLRRATVVKQTFLDGAER